MLVRLLCRHRVQQIYTVYFVSTVHSHPRFVIVASSSDEHLQVIRPVAPLDTLVAEGYVPNLSVAKLVVPTAVAFRQWRSVFSPGDCA